MNLDIRENIRNNFKGNDIDAIKDSIEESIKKGDEVTLPGLGVFFEIIWNNSDASLKSQILDIIKNNI